MGTVRAGVDLLLVEGAPTRSRKAEGIQLPRQLAKAYPLCPAGGNKGRRLPQARVQLKLEDTKHYYFQCRGLGAVRARFVGIPALDG
jgi:hypothetical protein